MSPINRAPFDALVDDDGTGTTGTVWNKQQIQDVILDPIDAEFAAARGPGWQAYAPLWGSFGAVPSIGNGTLAGSYATIAGITYFEIYLLAGSTTNFGTTDWTFNVPALIVQSAPSRYFMILTGRAFSGSAGKGYSVAGAIPFTESLFVLLSATGGVSSIVPFAWAAGDYLQLSGAYRSS